MILTFGNEIVKIVLFKAEGVVAMTKFPRTMVENISLPRMLIGTNWVLGWSHTSASANTMIKRSYASREAVCALVEAYLQYDIDAMMAPFGDPTLMDGIHMAEDHTGKKVILIDTPQLNMDDTAEGRREAEARIAASEKMGCSLLLIHQVSGEKLMNRLTRTFDRLPDYTDMIRQHGLIPGLGAHIPDTIAFCDENEYDIQTYIQPYNCVGFLMQQEVELVRGVIERAKKPVMSIKSMAAGRVSPYVGLTFSFSTLRPCDMVTVGAFSPDEVHEDVEIATAALERRFPEIKGF